MSEPIIAGSNSAVYKGIIEKEVREELLDIYYHSDNQWKAFGQNTLPGEEGKMKVRHVLSSHGRCLMCRFTAEELASPWNKIKDLFEKKYELHTARVMRYAELDFLPLHCDEGSGLRNIIVPLNDPKSYEGGRSLICNKIVDLELGDALVIFPVDLHGVTKVEKGVRLIMNFIVREL